MTSLAAYIYNFYRSVVSGYVLVTLDFPFTMTASEQHLSLTFYFYRLPKAVQILICDIIFLKN